MFFAAIFRLHCGDGTGFREKTEGKKYHNYKEFIIAEMGIGDKTYRNYQNGTSAPRGGVRFDKLKSIWCNGDSAQARHFLWELCVAFGFGPERELTCAYSAEIDRQRRMRTGFPQIPQGLLYRRTAPEKSVVDGYGANTERRVRVRKTLADYLQTAAEDLADAACIVWRDALADAFGTKQPTGNSQGLSSALVEAIQTAAACDLSAAVSRIRIALEKRGKAADPRSDRALEKSAFSLLALALLSGAFSGADKLPDESGNSIHRVSAKQPLGAALLVSALRGEDVTYGREGSDAKIIPKGFVPGDAVGITPGRENVALLAEVMARADRSLEALLLDENIDAAHILARISEVVLQDARDNRIFWRIYFDSRQAPADGLETLAADLYKGGLPTVVYGHDDEHGGLAQPFSIEEGRIDTIIWNFIVALEGALGKAPQKGAGNSRAQRNFPRSKQRTSPR